MAEGQKKIVRAPRSPRIIDADGNLTREWLAFLNQISETLNDLSARVQKLESQ